MMYHKTVSSACTRSDCGANVLAAHKLSYHIAVVLVSSSLLLTANLREGEKIEVTPLNGSKLSPHLPSLRKAQTARRVRLAEMDIHSKPQAGSSSSKQAGRGAVGRRDWLTLLIREALGMSLVISQKARLLV